MRAVIYARYSTELQREASIEDQVRVCHRLIEGKGWTASQVYSDLGMSGASHLRPGYQKLLEDARARAFGVVVAESIDRISRDQGTSRPSTSRCRFRASRRSRSPRARSPNSTSGSRARCRRST